MLRITVSESVVAAKSYYSRSLVDGDYYVEGGEVSGDWGGRAAAMLGLEGKVNPEGFAALLENRRPEVGPLTLRTAPNRRPGYDFTFDVPKSVTLAHAFSGDERIVEAMRLAIRETMTEVEIDMHTRVRKGGAFTDRPTGSMVWAEFTHLTSRPTPVNPEVAKRLLQSQPWLKAHCDRRGQLLLPDPHLHQHVFVINATFDPVEKQWKAGEFMRLKRDGPYYQAAYHVRLAAQLQKLGYQLEPTAKAFELVGVPREALEAFSRRTHEIEATAAALGIRDPDQKAELGAKTRRFKDPDLASSTLKRAWEGMVSPSCLQAIQQVCRKAKAQQHPQPIEEVRLTWTSEVAKAIALLRKKFENERPPLIAGRDAITIQQEAATAFSIQRFAIRQCLWRLGAQGFALRWAAEAAQEAETKRSASSDTGPQGRSRMRILETKVL